MKQNNRSKFFIALSILFLFSCNPSTPTPSPTPEPEIDYDALAKNYKKEIASTKVNLSTYSVTLNKVFNLLSEFETQLIQSKINTYSINTITVFREQKYSGTEWSLIAGSSNKNIKSKFNDFKESDFAKENWMELNSNYVDKFDISIDFYHMLAVANTYMYTTSISERQLASYGGDISQLVVELKSLPAGVDLLDYATNHSNNFSDLDLYADIDGANIINIYSNTKYYKNTPGIALAYSYYYLNTNSNKERMDYFVNNEFNSFNKDDIYSSLSSNLYLKIWNSKNNIDFKDDKNLFEIAIQAFINRINKFRD